MVPTSEIYSIQHLIANSTSNCSVSRYVLVCKILQSVQMAFARAS